MKADLVTYGFQLSEDLPEIAEDPGRLTLRARDLVVDPDSPGEACGSTGALLELTTHGPN